MKKHCSLSTIGASLAIAACLIATNAKASSIGFTDTFDGPTLDPAWQMDRALPQGTTVNGQINMTIGPGGHNANTFYDYEGYQRSTGPGGVQNWVATADLNVTTELEAGQANTGFWIRTGNGTDESTADYNIIAFRNPTGVPGAGAFYTWDDVNGVWILASGVIPSIGEHTFQMSYSAGAIDYSIDGITIRTDLTPANPTYADTATTAFLNSFNFGGDRGYDASYDNVSVRSVPDIANTAGLLLLAVPGMLWYNSRKKPVRAPAQTAAC